MAGEDKAGMPKVARELSEKDKAFLERHKAKEQKIRQELKRKELTEAAKTKPKPKTIVCSYCAEAKLENEFYADANMPIGKMTICKQCLRSMSYDAKGDFNPDLFVSMLKKVNKPFIFRFLDSAMKSGHEIIGTYFKSIGNNRFNTLTFTDSEFGPYDPERGAKMFSSGGIFVVTDDIIKFWGKGYDPIDYEMFCNKYEELSPSYPEKTAFHTERLKEYIRFQCKGERAMAENNIGSAQTWFNEARKSADAAKINPKQMSQADLSGGMDTLEGFFREIEKAEEIMDILPDFRFRPKDSVDFTLWCYINYIRDIKGLPQAEYSEIYQFYDKAKEKYIAENGDAIFENDPTIKNRKNIEKWVTYNDGYQQSDSDEEVM